MNTIEPSDADLIAEAREGVMSAYAKLWTRHSPAGLAYARTFSRIAAADDLVAESFTRILTVLRAGKGPTVAFRPYLMSVIRNTAIAISNTRKQELVTDDFTSMEGAPSAESLTLEGTDRSIAARAFQSLPTRWQKALWYSEVEQLSRHEIAEILDVKPNAVSQLTFRARDALRTAWIQAHVKSERLPKRCQDTAGLLGGYARANLSRRDLRRIEGHLSECEQCPEVVSELRPLRSGFPSLALLVLIGAGAGVAGVTLVPRAEPSYADTRFGFELGALKSSAAVSRLFAGAAAAAFVTGVAVASQAAGEQPAAGTAAAQTIDDQARRGRGRPHQSVPTKFPAPSPHAGPVPQNAWDAEAAGDEALRNGAKSSVESDGGDNGVAVPSPSVPGGEGSGGGTDTVPEPDPSPSGDGADPDGGSDDIPMPEQPMPEQPAPEDGSDNVAKNAVVVDVPLTEEHVRTGVVLAPGDLIEILGTGSGTYGWEGGDCAGQPTTDVTGARRLPERECDAKFDSFAPLPSAPVGALIGRIGDGAWFLIGDHYIGAANRDGELELRVNDANLADNTGMYTVSIKS